VHLFDRLSHPGKSTDRDHRVTKSKKHQEPNDAENNNIQYHRQLYSLRQRQYVTSTICYIARCTKAVFSANN